MSPIVDSRKGPLRSSAGRMDRSRGDENDDVVVDPYLDQTLVGFRRSMSEKSTACSKIIATSTDGDLLRKEYIFSSKPCLPPLSDAGRSADHGRISGLGFRSRTSMGKKSSSQTKPGHGGPLFGFA